MRSRLPGDVLMVLVLPLVMMAAALLAIMALTRVPY